MSRIADDASGGLQVTDSKEDGPFTQTPGNHGSKIAATEFFKIFLDAIKTPPVPFFSYRVSALPTREHHTMPSPVVLTWRCDFTQAHSYCPS